MIVYFILSFMLAYVWVSGGLFIAFLVAGEDFNTKSGKLIIAFILIWPFVVTWAIMEMVAKSLIKFTKRLIF